MNRIWIVSSICLLFAFLHVNCNWSPPTGLKCTQDSECGSLRCFRGVCTDCEGGACVEVSSEPQTEPQEEPKPEPKAETTTEPKSEPKADEPRSEPATEPQAEPTIEPKTEPVVERGETPAVDVMSDAGEQSPDTPAREVLAEVKPEPTGCQPGAKEACYDGKAGCSLQAGKYTCIAPCVAGERTCQSDGKWGSCTGQVLPKVEVCDEKDNDCDGKIDNGLFCTKILQDGFDVRERIWDIDVDQKGLLYVTHVVAIRGRVTTLERMSPKNKLVSIPIGIAANPVTGIGLLGSAGEFVATTTIQSLVSLFDVTLQRFDHWGRGRSDGDVLDGTIQVLNATATFNKPHGVAVNASEQVFIVGQGRGVIRQVERVVNGCGNMPNYKGFCVSTVAGDKNQKGFVDGPGLDAQFNGPTGIAVSDSGTLYVADQQNHAIRKLERVVNQKCGTKASFTGYCVTTLAGAGVSGYKDDAGKRALFNIPFKLAVDKDENVYVSDHFNKAIRMIDKTGKVSTIVGRGTTTLKFGDKAIPGKQVNFDVGSGALPLGIGYDKKRQVIYVGVREYLYEVNVIQ